MCSTRLFVGNVPETVNENDIQSAFSSYGQIISVDLKNRTDAENDQKKFAFVTLTASNYDVESCIKHFSTEDFHGNRLYVTRARESFLERLQRERLEAQRKEAEKNEPGDLSKINLVINLGDKLNPRKRKIDSTNDNTNKQLKPSKPFERKQHHHEEFQCNDTKAKKDVILCEKDKKKQDAEKKRLESIRKKRQEFKEKKMIIRTGLVGIDKVTNKKVIFSDSDEGTETKLPVNGISDKKNESSKKNNLFADEESDTELNFEIKKQFEGKKGQKVLDLQSRYKSDKRFKLDERFIEDAHSDEEHKEKIDIDENIDLGDADEKTKQLNILQDVLGVTIKTKNNETENKKSKTKLGMLRFDPTQPEHAKFFAPVDEVKQEPAKKLKKKKTKEEKDEVKKENSGTETEKVQVSKEQFYKVSETLKEALVQPATFSLRSLFSQNEEGEKGKPVQDTDYLPLEKAKDVKKNPLAPLDKNPFVYDSSDSEPEEADETKKVNIPAPEVKAVWKENLFFSKSDSRLIDGLTFFNQSYQTEPQKERRELKSVMKKRIYNKDRKNQMFQKKIGGRKKSLKKDYRKKS